MRYTGLLHGLTLAHNKILSTCLMTLHVCLLHAGMQYSHMTSSPDGQQRADMGSHAAHHDAQGSSCCAAVWGYSSILHQL